MSSERINRAAETTTVTTVDDFQRRGIELVRDETAKALREAATTVRVDLDTTQVAWLVDLLATNTSDTAHLLRVQLLSASLRHRQ